MNTFTIGDCRETMRGLEPGIFRTCVTSPPYWGLRDYGVDGQLGLEATPDEYVAGMVDVFREVRRVLADDGTLWLNLGDTYASNGGHADTACNERRGAYNIGNRPEHDRRDFRARGGGGLKPKDLVGIPWMVAFALRADGWCLRSEILWNKPNPMPESVTDRPTKAHEQLFLFAKAKWAGPPPGRFDHVAAEDARWLALLLDAEGCIVVKRNRHDGRGDTFAPQISIGNTSEALMREVVRIVGHGSLLERPGKNCRMLYWQLANELARDLLTRIYPFLIVKQRQARIAIHVDSLTYARGGQKPERKRRGEAETRLLESLWSRNKECNHFGTPDLSDVPEPVIGRWAECERYYYDAEAVKEPAVYGQCLPSFRGDGGYTQGRSFNNSDGTKAKTAGLKRPTVETRNRRTVWTIPTEPYPGSHFATFPTALVTPCILAGSALGDAVLDPFLGSGTVGMVAESLGRRWFGCELNPKYGELIRQRTAQSGLRFAP